MKQNIRKSKSKRTKGINNPHSCNRVPQLLVHSFTAPLALDLLDPIDLISNMNIKFLTSYLSLTSTSSHKNHNLQKGRLYHPNTKKYTRKDNIKNTTREKTIRKERKDIKLTQSIKKLQFKNPQPKSFTSLTHTLLHPPTQCNLIQSNPAI